MIKFFDLGTIQTIPDQFIYALPQDMSPEKISPLVKYCTLGKLNQEYTKQQFLEKISYRSDGIVGLKTMWSKQLSESQNFSVDHDVPFYKENQKIITVELYEIPENADLDGVFNDLSRLQNIFSLKPKQKVFGGVSRK